MLRLVLTSLRRPLLVVSSWLLVPVGLSLSACGSDEYMATHPSTATGPSAAYGLWTPGPNDTCTKEVHDRYSTIGPDGKLYPTWHPPVDPQSGCSFGHEHGRDPSGSKLYHQVGAIPFGLANEALDTWDPTGIRHEDHFGHKIEWENDVPMRISGPAGTVLNITCDVLTKLHQGTHSKDAFTNNLHELVYHIRCNDGTELHLTLLTAIGTPGEFQRSCDPDGPAVVVGAPTPANSPDGGGRRLIPDRVCVDQYVLVPPGQRSQFNNGIHESWQVSAGLRADDGHGLAFVNPYFQVFDPSRFYDPAATNVTGRTIDLCYEVESNGDRASSSSCDASTGNGTVLGVTFDDPRSVFNGAHRVVDINSTIISNQDGPEVWYTDPFGRHGRPAPFPGSVLQFVAKVNTDYGFNVSGPGLDHDYSQGVHAPN
ncbi:MAG TPA: hypothetical protein VLT17_05880 [Gemmatimonadales bacterium]|jgi:hypothetical protein|nr:hypothetical protein [Gemmatimonadales bacterium]